MLGPNNVVWKSKCIDDRGLRFTEHELDGVIVLTPHLNDGGEVDGSRAANQAPARPDGIKGPSNVLTLEWRTIRPDNVGSQIHSDGQSIAGDLPS